MTNKLLIRLGDLVLKGKNRNTFLKQVKVLIKEKLKENDCILDFNFDRIYITINDENQINDVCKKLGYVSGIQSYSFIYECDKDMEEMIKLANFVVRKEIKNKISFKIETRRADKTFNLQSLEVTKQVADNVLKNNHDLLTVDVRNPDKTLFIEIRKEKVYMFFDYHKLMGGFPVGIGGKGLVMLSGGIDSPVSAYLAIKQGIAVELFHFESTPLTPLESVQKVIDLAKKVANYMPNNMVKLHLVPFIKTHEEILKNVSDSYIITIMRRMMYRLAENYANKHDLLCLINGESVGQVASQTLYSIKSVENVTNLPIIRPLVTYDKQDIVNISKKIDTYDISIRSFNDCCTVYVPRNPIIKPNIDACLVEENKFEYKSFLENAINDIVTLHIRPNTDFNIADYGFDCKEAYTNYKEQGGKS